MELFAHDREALAWLVADAERDVVGAVHAAAESAGASRWPARSRLAMAAIEVLEEREPRAAPPRARSPILEMPSDLRYRAHRIDTRDAIVGLLGRVRHTRAGWGWLIVETVRLSPPADLPYYVQFSSYPGPGIRAEAVGDSHLPDGMRLNENQRAQMLRLGWQEGTLTESTGNWLQQVRARSPEHRASVAELALATLETLSGLGSNLRLREAAHVWKPESSREVPHAD